MGHAIVVTPEAHDHLDAIYDYIAAATSPEIAQNFASGILDHIAKLTDFPRRGTTRDDLRPGLRTIAWQRRVVIAFVVEETAGDVTGIFYGGRDFEAILGNHE